MKTTRLMGSESNIIMSAMLLNIILRNLCGDKNRYISTTVQDIWRLLTILAFLITLETIFHHFATALQHY